jgi:predicted aspartyl protease
VKFPLTIFGDGKFLPILRVQLGRAGTTIFPGASFPTIIDTGATWSLFPESMGEDLGLDITDGRREETRCANGETMFIYVHKMRLAFKDIRLDLDAAFGEEVGFPVLGRVGFLEAFKFTVDYRTKTFELV